ncbi:MAG: hypothetical protein OSJ23_02250 [Mucispirillum schaedleri]|nr:hypothetical protein [Mucispirillum schaedleri]
MVTAERRQKQIRFHSVDLYNSIQIPVRDYLLELTKDLELAVLLNQMIFSKKEYMTLNDIKRLSLNEKTKQTIRVKLEQLIEFGLIKKYKNNKIIYNQDLYTVSDSIISAPEDNKILGIVEGKDLNYEFHYLMAMIINKFRTYALSGINELTISVYQLKIMLGVNNSESSIRNVLNQLEEDNYITIENSNNINTYIINTDKIINNYSLEDIKKYTDELVKYYEEYLKRMAYYIYKNRLKNQITIDDYIKKTLDRFKNMIKKMFETGKADYYILKHIIIYLIHNIDLEKYTNPSAIKKEYNELAELSKDLSKRKAKRFIYKFQNNLLNEESCKALNKIYWEEAYKLIDNYKNIFRLKYFESRAGVNLIDFEDYKQEAVYTVYKTLKKYNIIDINDNTKYDAEFLLSAILYRLKEKMFNNRETVETEENKRTIVKYSTDISNLNLSAYLNNEEQEQEQVEIDFDTNTGINKLFSILNERSIFIIKKYTGYDGQTLTFKEIGEKLGITESITARIYKRAIQQLRQHFPPDKEQELRQLIFKT